MKFLRRREERKLAKDKAVQTKTMTALKDAIKDIKNKDAKGLLEAKKVPLPLESELRLLAQKTLRTIRSAQTKV